MVMSVVRMSCLGWQSDPQDEGPKTNREPAGAAEVSGAQGRPRSLLGIAGWDRIMGFALPN